MQDNLVSVNFEKDELQIINDCVKKIESILKPKLVNLNNEQRKELAKMGDKTFAFVVKSLEYANQNPALVPSYVDVEEMKIDIEAVQTLRQIANPLNELTQSLEDTMMLSGSEAYIAALSFYNAIKGAAKSKIGGAEQILNDLSQRFAGRPRKSSEK